MKKNVIALSAVAALLSMAGAANAAVVPVVADAGLTDGAALVAGGVAVVPATTTEVNAGGLGHKLVFPYFTTQGSNNTLVNIVNTDTRNGKALKVRFRGAGNSDDLFDFQVLMSPGDVWTASLTQGADGVTRLTTTDNTCVIPSKAAINVAFSNTNRLDPSKDIANQTREGYIEVINMADIPPVVIQGAASTASTTTNSLFSVVKHNSSGVATCDSTATGVAVLERLKTNVTLGTAADGVIPLNAIGLTYPTTGLAGDWVILNTESQAAWSGSAVALEARAGAAGARTAATANAVFFPQLPTRVTTLAPQDTTDPLLVAGVVTPLLFDFPDMSTAYSAADANGQRTANTNALLTGYIGNEWNSDAAIGGATDMLFSQPMRRYWAAVNYKATGSSDTGGAFATTGTVAVALFNDAGSVDSGDVSATGTTSRYNSTNTVMAERLLCIADVQLTQYDREERTTTSGFVVSPGVATQLNICGEAAVTSINAGGVAEASALEASVARNDVTLSFDKDGWLSVGFGTGNSFPIVGAAFLKVSNAVQSYGFAFPHKTK